VNYYERHLGDYAKDAGHLSMVEHGAYTLLLDRYYATEQPIPADQVYRVCRARTDDERAAVDAVLAEFFVLTDGAWAQGRADAELDRYRGKREKAKASATARWGSADANAMRTHSERTANAQRTQCEGNALQSPVTSNQEIPPNPRKRGQDEPAGFARFWTAWPTSQRKVARAQCLRKWLKAGCEDFADRVVASVEAHKLSADWTKDSGGFIPAPIVWLNQSRWEAELPASPAASSIASGNAELQRAREQAARAVPPPTAVLELAKRMRVG
jgi:uncharacterized protein YdaU (DUF1376 family)